MAAAEVPLSIDVDGTVVSGVYARPARPAATLVIAHGAGSGMEHPFLRGFSAALNEHGVATLRFNFPYREAGKKFPDRPPAAVAAWRAAMDAAGARAEGEPLWAGGKSFGGRMASMAVAEGMPVAGLVFLGYPLHPPGRPEKLRDEHLYGTPSPPVSCWSPSSSASALRHIWRGLRVATIPSPWPGRSGRRRRSGPASLHRWRTSSGCAAQARLPGGPVDGSRRSAASRPAWSAARR